MLNGKHYPSAGISAAAPGEANQNQLRFFSTRPHQGAIDGRYRSGMDLE